MMCGEGFHPAPHQRATINRQVKDAGSADFMASPCPAVCNMKSKINREKRFSGAGLTVNLDERASIDHTFDDVFRIGKSDELVPEERAGWQGFIIGAIVGIIINVVPVRRLSGELEQFPLTV